ncbi:MAG: glycosyl hydrolase, partial [Bacteroidetes bacterium]|nr:glycosyl hydrolase [Bacteroidota bacterium]
MKKFLLLFLLITGLSILVFFSNSCQQNTHSTTHRGHDPWVFRSVLDQKARMVTVALSDSFWIAYDAQHTGLYKVWRSGVKFEGAVYNTAHGPQPTSYGPAYLLNTNTHPWKIIFDGEEITPEVNYLGHKFEGNHVVLSYELNWGNGNQITITEKPELVFNQYGMPGLERTFVTSDIPKGAEILMHTSINSVRSENDIQTNGNLEISNRSSTTIKGVYILQADGVLTLNHNGTTQFTTYFYPEPAIQPQKAMAEQEEAEHPGLVLLEQNDCRTCHNETLKTVGPSYTAIAERYATNAANVNRLANNIINGTSGTWGEAAMTAHPDLTKEDAVKLVSYILTLDGEPPLEEAEEEEAPQYSMADLKPGQGVVISVYMFPENLNEMPEINDNISPVFSGVIPAIHVPEGGFPDQLTNNFYIHAKGYINIPEENNYVFRLISDDGSILTIDDQVVIDHGGLHGPDAKDSELILSAGEHPFTLDYFQSGGGATLSLQWIAHGEDDFTVIPPTAFTFDSTDIQQSEAFVASAGELVDAIPGDGRALASVHPSFTLNTIRPEAFQPKVGGMDFLSDGRLIVSTWDPKGTIYMLENIQESVAKNNPELVTYKIIAQSLAEPLGLKVVDDEIYVLQKHEL